ncbi:hypothetical protein N7445_004916 [Penicillium cf. griseofulvum]|nr:hypothetical protein N7445_004916 [Penicillium cf. griseofulvum]
MGERGGEIGVRRPYSRFSTSWMSVRHEVSTSRCQLTRLVGQAKRCGIRDTRYTMSLISAMSVEA